MSNVNYRNLAKTHIDAAKNKLSENSDSSLKYAALELRMSLEALTYDRAVAYKDEFPPDEYETWQPRKVMSVLLDIDPSADKNTSIAAGIEEEYGKQASKMNWLGSEEVLNMAMLKRHYDALGSYLHIQSIKKSRKGQVTNYEKLRKRCNEIVILVEKVISSPVFNITVGSFSTIQCMDCEKQIRKRIPYGESLVNAECYECKASYTLSVEEESKVKWVPHEHELECANPDCQHKIKVWSREIEVGKYWFCKECKGENKFVISIQYKDA